MCVCVCVCGCGCASLQILVIEGLHPFFDKRVRDLLDFKIYLDISDEIKFAWKIQRDMAERGHSLDSIKKSIEARKPDFDAYIDPQKKDADVIIQVLPATKLVPMQLAVTTLVSCAKAHHCPSLGVGMEQKWQDATLLCQARRPETDMPCIAMHHALADSVMQGRTAIPTSRVSVCAYTGAAHPAGA